MKQTVGTVHGLSSGRGGTRPGLGFVLCGLAPGRPPPPPQLSGGHGLWEAVSEVRNGDPT